MRKSSMKEFILKKQCCESGNFYSVVSNLTGGGHWQDIKGNSLFRVSELDLSHLKLRRCRHWYRVEEKEQRNGSVEGRAALV